MRHIKQILKHTIQELQMDFNQSVLLYFKLYSQCSLANEKMNSKTPKLDRQQVQTAAATVFIAETKHGVPLSDDSQSDGYNKDEYVQPKTQQGNWNPDYPQFDPKIGQIPRPESWDGSEACQAPKYKGDPWSSLKDKSVEAYAEKNDDDNYHNKARWELERRASDDIGEPPPPDDEDESQLPF